MFPSCVVIVIPSSVTFKLLPPVRSICVLLSLATCYCDVSVVAYKKRKTYHNFEVILFSLVERSKCLMSRTVSVLFVGLGVIVESTSESFLQFNHRSHCNNILWEKSMAGQRCAAVTTRKIKNTTTAFVLNHSWFVTRSLLYNAFFSLYYRARYKETVPRLEVFTIQTASSGKTVESFDEIR